MTPEFCEPIWNQQLVVKQNIRRLKVFGQGACIMTCVLEKDILYPRDSINLQVYLDNSKCKRKVEKYTVRFVKRVQFFEKNKIVFLNDEIFHEKVVKAKCDKNQTEDIQFLYQIPDSIFKDDIHQKRLPVVNKEDKAFTHGPSTSFTGKLFKVQYAIQVFVKHQGVGSSLASMKEASIPLIIMTPSRNIMNTDKPKIKQHPNWQPYEYKLKEYFLDEADEAKQPYSKYRKGVIEKERLAVE